jgi:hypothetical protein
MAHSAKSNRPDALMLSESDAAEVVRARRNAAAWQFAEVVGKLVAQELAVTPGVEAAFVSRDGDAVFVVAREHSAVDREALLEIEDRLAPQVGRISIEVRASQGRNPHEMFRGLETRII